jgi:hypothetical protein
MNTIAVALILILTIRVTEEISIKDVTKLVDPVMEVAKWVNPKTIKEMVKKIKDSFGDSSDTMIGMEIPPTPHDQMLWQVLNTLMNLQQQTALSEQRSLEEKDQDLERKYYEDTLCVSIINATCTALILVSIFMKHMWKYYETYKEEKRREKHEANEEILELIRLLRDRERAAHEHRVDDEASISIPR